MKKVLFVCLGNICRSPLADGLLRKKVAKENLNFEVDSAGTADYHVGQAPDSRMIATAKKFGTDISFLKGRQFTASDFEKFDFIYVMDKSNYNNVMKLAKNDKDASKVKLLLQIINSESEKEVPDPYYGTQKEFDEVYHLLDEATDILLEKLKK